MNTRKKGAPAKAKGASVNKAGGELLSEAEALRMLGFSSRMPLYNLRKNHLIGFYKCASGVIRYSRQHIEDYLASIEQKPRKRVRRGSVRDEENATQAA